MNVPMIGTLNVNVTIQGDMPLERAKEIARAVGISFGLGARESLLRRGAEARMAGLLNDDQPLVDEISVNVDLSGRSA